MASSERKHWALRSNDANCQRSKQRGRRVVFKKGEGVDAMRRTDGVTRHYLYAVARENLHT